MEPHQVPDVAAELLHQASDQVHIPNLHTSVLLTFCLAFVCGWVFKNFKSVKKSRAMFRQTISENVEQEQETGGELLHTKALLEQALTEKEAEQKKVRKLLQKQEEAAEAKKCAVCLDKKKTHVTFPCRHVCVCGDS